MHSFVFNWLGENRSQTVDKYNSYSYPILAVKVRWYCFRLMFAIFDA